jgi:hypothetical protein
VEGPIVAVEAADLDAYLEDTRDDVGNGVLVRMRPARWLTVDYAKHPRHRE